MLITWLGDVCNAESTGAAEHHDVQQRVGAQAVGAVHGGTGSLARSEQALHHLHTNTVLYIQKSVSVNIVVVVVL